MKFIRLLRSDKAELDKQLFLKWEGQSIDTPTCMRVFKYNNGIPEDFYINTTDFIIWLRSLGYRR